MASIYIFFIHSTNDKTVWQLYDLITFYYKLHLETIVGQFHFKFLRIYNWIFFVKSSKF